MSYYQRPNGNGWYKVPLGSLLTYFAFGAVGGLLWFQNLSQRDVVFGLIVILSSAILAFLTSSKYGKQSYINFVFCRIPFIMGGILVGSAIVSVNS